MSDETTTVSVEDTTTVTQSAAADEPRPDGTEGDSGQDDSNTPAGE